MVYTQKADRRIFCIKTSGWKQTGNCTIKDILCITTIWLYNRKENARAVLTRTPPTTKVAGARARRFYGYQRIQGKLSQNKRNL